MGGGRGVPITPVSEFEAMDVEIGAELDGNGKLRAGLPTQIGASGQKRLEDTVGALVGVVVDK